MIDWATVIVPCIHTAADISGGMVIRLCPNGSVEQSRELGLSVRGSYDSSVYVSSHNPSDAFRGYGVKSDDVLVTNLHDRDRRDWVRIDGNPSKWFYGHNLFGPRDPLLIWAWITDVLDWLRLRPSDSWRRRTRLNRIDVTRSFRLSSDADCTAWIRAAETHSVMAYRGRGNLSRGGTLYWGKHSRHWAGKIYNKFRELQAHPISDNVADKAALIEWAVGVCRVEFVWRSAGLKNHFNLKYLKDLTLDLVNEIWNHSMKQITFNTSTRLTGDVPPAAARTFELWSSGIDPQRVLSRSTWYRHRRMLLEHGIDISAPVSRGTTRSAMDTELLASPAVVPGWYKRTAAAPDLQLVA